MRNQRTVRQKKISRRGLLAGMALLLFVGFFRAERAMAPLAEQACQTAIQSGVTELLCQAAGDSLLAAGEVSYTTVLYNQDGSIAAVEVASGAVNRLQKDLTDRAAKALEEYTRESISVPMGAVSGSTLLAGHGPNIRVRLCPLGAVTPTVESQFQEAGMNQTIHRLTLTLTAEVQVIAPLYRDTISVRYPFLLSETWLVGPLPDYLLAGGGTLPSNE